MKRLHLETLLGVALLVVCARSGIGVARAQDATLVNARIVVGDGPVISNGYVSVQSGKIIAVGPGRPPRILGTLIDAAGMTALPGFIDGHKHLDTSPLGEKEQMEDLIDNGFTTVLSALGPAASNLALIKQIDSGQINGPRIIASGRVDLHGTPEQARAAIRAMAHEGIRFTGEMAVTPEPGPTAQELAVLRAAVDEGKQDGVTVVVHAVSTPAMVAATEAGVRHEVHLPNKDFMGYDDAARIAASGTFVLDTVSYGAPIIDVFQQDDLPRFRTGLAWPNAIAGANRDEEGRATGTEAAYSMMNARRVWDATHGRGLGYGSDQNYPVRDVLEHELKSLIVMLSVPDVVRVLTINTASFLDMQNEIGTLEPLKRADIVLVAGNPAEDFNDLLKTRMVLKDGKVVVDQRTDRAASGEPRSADSVSAVAAAGAAGAAAAAATTGAMVGTLTASVARPDQPPVMSCRQMSRVRLAHGRLSGATEMPAGDRRAGAVELPAHCALTARLRGVRRGDIRLTLWLPNHDWNGSFVLAGDGSAIASETLTRPLIRGYAVASLAIGRTGARGRARERLELANRAVHEAAEASKMLIRELYGAAPRYSYWISVTADGRQQPLEEVQRYPEDFDGMVFGSVAGAQTAGTAAAGSPSADAASPDLSAFATRGGKIIEHEGGADQATAEQGVNTYESLLGRGRGLAQTRNFYRLFLMPAQERGDSYRTDWLTALDEWVQRDRVPDEVLADHIPPADAQRRPPAGLVFEPQYGVRTVCAYPDVARLQGGRGETPVDWMCLPKVP
ncbi:MAG: tannase/feruloyl esterase family alpha/beta hydrolase [Steroidobacteraceae bacterium]